MKKIIVLTGTSGVGKTTISHYLAAAYHISAIITHTTRPPRSQEKMGWIIILKLRRFLPSRI